MSGEKLIPFEKDEDEWGYKDEEGNVIIPCKYKEVGEFSEGVATVRSWGTWYYIDRTGEKVISRSSPAT